MNEVKFGTEAEESKGKWSLSNFVYLREGRKKRISLGFLKISFGLVALLFVGFQLLSAFKSETEAIEVVGFDIPTNIVDSNTVALEHYGGTASNKSQPKKAAKTRPLFFEVIKPVSFKRTNKIPSGIEVNASLVSGGSNGIVKARISEAIVSDGETLAEKGSVLLGEGSSTDERLYIKFYKLVRPGFADLKVSAQAFDNQDRILGLKGSKVGDTIFKIAASSGLFFLSGMAEGMQNQTDSFMPHKKSTKDAALQGVAQATVEHGREIVSSMNNKSIIEVKHSTPIIVIFENGDENEK